jgi:hypothetical protein
MDTIFPTVAAGSAGVGGRRMTALAVPEPVRSAVFSDCGRYRYYLSRTIGGGGSVATFIMLNPSTADHRVDDPTIRKATGFALRWGCGELHVVNLFAFRATRPAELRKAADPVGADNRAWVRRAVGLASDGLVVCGWGIHGKFAGQDEVVLGWIADLCRPMCLGLTRGGHPRHPLYRPYAAELAAFGR